MNFIGNFLNKHKETIAFGVGAYIGVKAEKNGWLLKAINKFGLSQNIEFHIRLSNNTVVIIRNNNQMVIKKDGKTIVDLPFSEVNRLYNQMIELTKKRQ